MGDESKIEWTEATWNPIRGCSRVSEGCEFCFAERLAARFSKPGEPYHGVAEMTPSGPSWTGQISVIDNRINLPIRWLKPRRIFVNSTSDLFHENLDPNMIHRIFDVMMKADHHVFQVLTKRARNMMEFVQDRVEKQGPISKNIWLGISVENQKTADLRTPYLSRTPCAVKFISAEPLLGEIYFSSVGGSSDIHWIVVGGESGAKARPMNPNWVYTIKDFANKNNIAFFFKQWGEWAQKEDVKDVGAIRRINNGSAPVHIFNDGESVYRVGKRISGNLLLGERWLAMPDGESLEKHTNPEKMLSRSSHMRFIEDEILDIISDND